MKNSQLVEWTRESRFSEKGANRWLITICIMLATVMQTLDSTIANGFANGAKAARGLRIIVLPAGAGEISRIAPVGSDYGPVSLGRTAIDLVVTKHGAADLRGLGLAGRAAALIAVVAPQHRESLAASWHDYSKRF
jgi:hypothetical protein